MKNEIIRLIKEIQLRGRFAARKLGLSDWQVHQICLQDKKLIYIPIPKNACTSIKQALHQIEFGLVYDTTQLAHLPYYGMHDYYNKRPDAFTSTDRIELASDFTRFAVVRDPVERLISCYRNRVVDLEDLKENESSLKKVGLNAMPDINTFVLNLKEYRKANKNIEHHSRPQSAFLGGTLGYLDFVFPMEDLDGLQQFLKQFSPELTFLKRKSGGTKFSVSDLSEDALEIAVQFYREDYKLLKEFYTP